MTYCKGSTKEAVLLKYVYVWGRKLLESSICWFQLLISVLSNKALCFKNVWVLRVYLSGYWILKDEVCFM